MRIYEGDHAYEIEQILNPETQVRSGWRYKVYRVRPAEQVLRPGEAGRRDEAETSGPIFSLRRQRCVASRCRTFREAPSVFRYAGFHAQPVWLL